MAHATTACSSLEKCENAPANSATTAHQRLTCLPLGKPDTSNGRCFPWVLEEMALVGLLRRHWHQEEHFASQIFSGYLVLHGMTGGLQCLPVTPNQDMGYLVDD